MCPFVENCKAAWPAKQPLKTAGWLIDSAVRRIARTRNRDREVLAPELLMQRAKPEDPMKTLMMSLALGAGLLAAAPAHAVNKGIVAFAPVRTQIRNELKNEGLTKNLVRPSLRVQIKGNKATAQVYSMATQWPQLGKKVRMLQATATFKLQSLPDGKLARPVKSGGQVWHWVMHLASAGQ
jgi:hypothetical protein